MDYVDLGKRIRARRTELNWTQGQLAREIGVSTSFVGHIERGSRKASIETLVLLANALHVSTDELLKGSLKPEIEFTAMRLSRGQRQVMAQMISTLQDQILRWDEEE